MQKDGELTEEEVANHLSGLGRSATGQHHVYQFLSVPRQNLKNVSVLCNYIHLQKLELPYNKIKDLSCVSHMPYLIILDASHNELSEFFGFQPPKHLKEVDFSHNQMSAMKDLSAYTSLSKLILDYNSFSEIRGLEKCSSLTHLSIAHNKISRISGLNNLPLKHLCLSIDNKLSECSGIGGVGGTGGVGVVGDIGSTGGVGVVGDIGSTSGVGGVSGIGGVGSVGGVGGVGDIGSTGGVGVVGDIGSTGGVGDIGSTGSVGGIGGTGGIGSVGGVGVVGSIGGIGGVSDIGGIGGVGGVGGVGGIADVGGVGGIADVGGVGGIGGVGSIGGVGGIGGVGAVQLSVDLPINLGDEWPRGNLIKKIEKLHTLRALQVLDLSSNRIQSLAGLQNLHFLGTINLESNLISEIKEATYVHDLPLLRELNLKGNPVQEQPDYRLALMFLLHRITDLDGEAVTAEEKVSAVNKYDPPLEVVAARDHMTHMVYQHMQPQVIFDSTLPSLDAPYPMLILTGPQACGKRELAHKLCQEFSDYFAYGACHTTRGPYFGEEDGADYHFVLDEEFQNMIRMGCFVQTMQYGGHWYGLSRETIESVAREGLACCVHMELEGVYSLRNSYFEPRYVLLIPTSTEEYISRMKARGLYSNSQIDTAVSRIDLYVRINREQPGFFDSVIPSGGSTFGLLQMELHKDDGSINTYNRDEAYRTLRKLVKEYLGLEEQGAGRVTPDNSHPGPRVWRRGGETYNHECVKRSVKFPQSVMVWGCMSARGVGKLCFLKKTVNAAVYQDVLETFLIPTVEEQFGEEDFIFQQDLAPAHAAKSTKDWFTKKQLEVLAWPANSPDLNVIENLWAIVKRKIRDRKPTTLDQLKQNIATAWEASCVVQPSANGAAVTGGLMEDTTACYGTGEPPAAEKVEVGSTDSYSRNYYNKVQAGLTSQRTSAELASIHRKQQMVREALMGKSAGAYTQLFKRCVHTAPSLLAPHSQPGPSSSLNPNIGRPLPDRAEDSSSEESRASSGLSMHSSAGVLSMGSPAEGLDAGSGQKVEPLDISMLGPNPESVKGEYQKTNAERPKTWFNLKGPYSTIPLSKQLWAISVGPFIITLYSSTVDHTESGLTPDASRSAPERVSPTVATSPGRPGSNAKPVLPPIPSGRKAAESDPKP
ncbi:hypothetical protein NFI96_033331 [Prochilodus magdalenae]|nr:hypothetical protein NFI96_033331 [Prochilodus magdalenae]